MAVFNKNLSTEIIQLFKEKNVFVISDNNVERLYGAYFKDNNKYIIEAGEDSKNINVLTQVCKKMLECGCNRKSKIIAIGGGVVGDLAGFTAAVFMRGIKWINIPTTLLSQVDSAIGGKTAVDLDDYKNILGAFHSPEEVYVSLHFLDTLPEREKFCGIGEIIKTVFLCKDLAVLAQNQLPKILSCDNEVIAEAVKHCIDYKEKIVWLDEKDTKGIRAALNIGHTIGHALEKADLHRLSHGEYVLWGLLFESFLTKKFVSMEQHLYMSTMLRKVLKGRTLLFDTAQVAAAAAFDKKNDGGRISIIAVTDNERTKELFFSEKEIYEGMELCRKEYHL